MTKVGALLKNGKTDKFKKSSKKNSVIEKKNVFGVWGPIYLSKKVGLVHVSRKKTKFVA